MPADFPSTPTLNQTYTFGGRTWTWNGTGWQLVANSTDKLTLTDGLVVPAASAATPSVRFTGSLSTGLYSPGTDQVAISTGGTGRVFVGADGKLSVGNPSITVADGAMIGAASSTGARLKLCDSDLGVTATDGFELFAADGGDAYVWQRENNPLLFGTNGAERLRITSDGKVGIGTSLPQAILHLNANTAGGVGANLRLTNYTARTAGNATRIEFANNNDYSFGSLSGAYIQSINPSADVTNNTDLVFGTGGGGNPQERLRITSDGKVGIGTSAPDVKLKVEGASGTTTFATGTPAQNGVLFASYDSGTIYQLAYASNSTAYVAGTQSNIPFEFFTNNTERARLDSSGRLLVGTSTGRNVATQNWGIQQEGTTFATTGISTTRNSADIYGSYFVLGKTRGTTVGATTVVQAGDELGGILFAGADGTTLNSYAASILAFVDGTPGTNDMPGRLVFSTTADGAATPTEAMRINNQRELLIGTTTRTANGGVLQVSNGITFPGTQSACSDPNTLDDYEEGTFTPTVRGETVAGTGTYTVQSGKYVKVGGIVYVEVQMTWTAHTGTGNMWFAGLPFTSATTGNGPGISFGRISNIALTANNVLLAYVASNSTIAPLRQYPVGGGAESTVPMDTAGDVNFSVTYMVV